MRVVMAWRLLVLAGYLALAVTVAIAYGARGVLILGFFYFWAGALAGFILVWNWLSREASRLFFRRLAGSR